MLATWIPIGLLVALLALTSCDGTTPQEPPPFQYPPPYCEINQCSFQLAYVWAGNIMVFDGATGGTRQLTTSDVNNTDLDAEWSPDGTRIALTRYSAVGGPGSSTPAATTNVYVMNADGSGVMRVTGGAAGSLKRSHSPTWSPRGDAIAFSSDGGPCSEWECGALAIYVQELSEGSVARSVAWQGLDPAWSPDGSRIAFVGLTGGDYPGALRLVNPDGSGLTEVPLAISGVLSGLTWSPDGTRIALSACNPACNIYVVRPDGSGLIQLTTSDHECESGVFEAVCGADSPTWSSDGTRIAYARASLDGEGRIMMIPADGGEPVVLVGHGAARGHQPSWRP